MSKSADPDNPTSREIEELTREEQLQQILEQNTSQTNTFDAISTRPDITEPAEVNTTGTDLETGKVPRDKEDHVRTSREAQPIRQDGVYSPIMHEIEDVLGYDADSNQPMLTGQIESIELEENEVSLTYSLREPLVNTSQQEITAPIIEQTDQSITQLAYNREDIDIDIEIEQGYEITFGYEGTIEDASTQIARALAEFETEIQQAYQLSEEQSEETTNKEIRTDGGFQYGNTEIPKTSAVELLDQPPSEVAVNPVYSREEYEIKQHLDNSHNLTG